MSKEIISTMKLELLKDSISKIFSTSICTPRNILNSAFTRNDLKESLRIFSVRSDIYSEDIIKVVKNVKEVYNLPENTPIETIFEKINSIRAEAITSMNQINIGFGVSKTIETHIINNYKYSLKQIDDAIVFAEASIKIERDNDERLNMATAKTYYKTLSDQYFGFDNPYLAIDDCNDKQKGLKSNDAFSTDNVKLVVRKLKIFKSGVMSIINKNYGKNTIFSPFNICEEVLK